MKLIKQVTVHETHAIPNVVRDLGFRMNKFTSIVPKSGDPSSHASQDDGLREQLLKQLI